MVCFLISLLKKNFYIVFFALSNSFVGTIKSTAPIPPDGLPKGEDLPIGSSLMKQVISYTPNCDFNKSKSAIVILNTPIKSLSSMPFILH